MKKKYLHLPLLVALALFFTADLRAQDFKALDESPHDIVYYRQNKISPPVIKVLYGRPQKKGREIFGGLVPYGEIWRVGANEATEVVFYKQVQFGEEMVEAGTYALYAIPGQEEWTLILSSKTDVWGVSEYDENFDVARAKAKVSQAEFVESFSIGFKEKGKSVNMVLAWDTARIVAPIKISI